MARRQVLEVQCDRCGKVETQETPKSTGTTIPEQELQVSFRGQSMEYGDLCVRCRSACENYFKSMTKQLDPDQPEEPKKKSLLGLGGS